MPNIKRGMMGAAGSSECADCGLFVWGRNNKGQLGTGDTTNLSSPVQVYADVPTDFSAGLEFGAYIDSGGKLWTVGENGDGQLGHGNTTDLSVWTQVGSGTDWDIVQSGRQSVIARKTGGTIWVWGAGDNGLTGDGTTDNKSTPYQVGTDTDWTTVMTWGYGNMGYKGTSLYQWGKGSSGQNGNGTTVNYSSPVLIGTGYLNTVRSSGSDNSGYATQVKTDNTIWSSGTFYYWSSGFGAQNVSTDTYTQLGSDDWTFICQGRLSNQGRRTNGDMYAWGYGASGAVGNGGGYHTPASSPVLVSGSHTWGAGFRQAAKGTYISSAIDTDGQLFTWGANNYGALALGDTSDRSVPVQVGAATDWSKVDAGNAHMMGVRTG